MSSFTLNYVVIFCISCALFPSVTVYFVAILNALGFFSIYL